MEKLRITIENDYREIDGVIRKIMKIADGRIADAPMYETALAEALNNVVEHSYGEQAKGNINIHIATDNDNLEVAIEDYGKGMEPEKFNSVKPEFDVDPDDLDSLPEGGFGIKILKAVMDLASYERDKNSNRLILVKAYANESA